MNYMGLHVKCDFSEYHNDLPYEKVDSSETQKSKKMAVKWDEGQLYEGACTFLEISPLWRKLSVYFCSCGRLNLRNVLMAMPFSRFFKFAWILNFLEIKFSEFLLKSYSSFTRIFKGILSSWDIPVVTE